MQPLKNKFIHWYLRHFKGMSVPKDLIQFASKRYANEVAVIHKNDQLTYQQLYDRACSLANALLKSGIKKGDKVGILIYNCIEYFEIRMATYLTGIVLVPLSRDLSLEDITFIANDCQIKTLIYHPKILEESIEQLKTNSSINSYIPISKEKGGSYEEFLSQGSLRLDDIPISVKDLASINFSSGTTGRPKGILLTQQNWMASFYNYLLNSQASLKANFTYLHLIPLATAGSTAVLPCLAKGAKSIITNDFDPEQIVFLIEKYDITRLFLTPSWFIDLLEYCRAHSIHLKSLDGIIVGTAPLAAEKLQQGINYFGPIIEIGYGMAEILPPLFLLSAKDYWKNGRIQEDKLASVGKQLKGVDIQILNKRKLPLAAGEIGEIALKSPTISQGYFNNEDLTAAHYQNKWFHSNDYGYLDEAGYLFVLGRQQDILFETNTQMEFARQSEEVIHQHPNIKEVCILDTIQTLTAVVSCKNPEQLVCESEIKDFCKNKLPESLIPDKIVICKALPTKTTGKLDREKIKEIAISSR